MQQQVLVVGAGPVGLTMAAELARYAVPVRIIDKSSERTDKSKALVMWSRTLELIDRMGCGPSFVAAGLKMRSVSIIAGSRQLAHISLDVPETPHPYGLMLPQSETERLMEQHLNANGVQVERQVELIHFTARADHVAATLRHPDGRDETIDAAWMIGCDGAHSSIRHGIGMQFEGNTLPSSWLLADIHLAGNPTASDEIATYWHADGLLMIFPIAPGRFRVIGDMETVAPGEHPQDPTVEAPARPARPRRHPGLGPHLAQSLRDQRAQSQQLPRRTHLPRGRRRPCPQPRRRAGHEHRHAGRLQPRLEAGLGVSRLGYS
jgi:2-polyprenyl-6-methoxyphenol hydroxylase-like FAD-dependent oxidoreductase